MIHPETGEVLETREQFQAAGNEIHEKIGALYVLAYKIGRERDIRYPPAPILPPARSRTPTQDRVARCPRCGMKLESEEAPA